MWLFFARHGLELVQPQWTVDGSEASSNVTIRNRRVEVGRFPEFESADFVTRSKSVMTNRGYRPSNDTAKYGRSAYDSAAPLCGWGPLADASD